jgi:hypothetical protein
MMTTDIAFQITNLQREILTLTKLMLCSASRAVRLKSDKFEMLRVNIFTDQLAQALKMEGTFDYARLNTRIRVAPAK